MIVGVLDEGEEPLLEEDDDPTLNKFELPPPFLILMSFTDDFLIGEGFELDLAPFEVLFLDCCNLLCSSGSSKTAALSLFLASSSSLRFLNLEASS